MGGGGGDSAAEAGCNGKAGPGGGTGDAYGEDRATEDQLITPWTVSVAR